MTPGRLFAVLAVVGIASLLVLKAAAPNPSGQSGELSDSDLKTLTIQLERTACFGTCPAYIVTLHGDGKVEYVGKDHVKVTERREGQVGVAAIKALVAQFTEAKFASIADQYSGRTCKCRRCTDFPSANTEIHAGSIAHRVEHYYGCACAPKPLFDLEAAIDKAVDSEQWTGDTSKAGPMGTTCFGP